jgi:hypothetical protein
MTFLLLEKYIKKRKNTVVYLFNFFVQGSRNKFNVSSPLSLSTYEITCKRLSFFTDREMSRLRNQNPLFKKASSLLKFAGMIKTWLKKVNSPF